MIISIIGKDYKKAIEKKDSIILDMLKSKPGANVFNFSLEGFNIEEFEGLLNSKGLFEESFVFVIRNVLEDEDFCSFILKRVVEMRDSKHVFIIIEEKLNKKEQDIIEKNSKEIFKFDILDDGSKKAYSNSFALANAVEKGDKKEIFIEYEKMLKIGEVEMVFGQIFWKFKDMILKNSFRTYKKERIQDFLYQLAVIYHDGHLGKGSIENRLRIFLLSL